MTLDDLKTKLKASLKDWKPRMAQAGVNSVYAFIASAALWQIVAAARGGEWAALTMLGALTANVSTGLLTNFIQSWKDESDGAKQIEAAVKNDPALRAELDEVLEKLGALQIARDSLSEADRQWFATTLRAELKKLGNEKRFELLIIGDHNINVQGDHNTLTVNNSTMQTDPSGGVNINDSDVKVGGNIVGRDLHIHQAPQPKPIDLPEALRRYLDNIIDTHQHLKLAGIRSGGHALSVDLEKVYVSLKALDKRQRAMDEKTDRAEMGQMERGDLTIPDAMKQYKRLVIIGDPGSGKTTLLSYLALTYARTLRDGANNVQERLQLDERKHLPILLPLRDFGQHLKKSHEDASKDGPALLLRYLHDYYKAQSIELPEDLFSRALDAHHAVVLLDGLDEVAETKLRHRISRIIEKFVVRYPQNRFIVTSREVGYDGAARIGEDFGLAKVRDFNNEEMRHFVRDWTRAVEVTLAGRESPDILRIAETQAEKLLKAIEGNRRIGDLAVNPLLLTVIALVHRYRASLPDRRAELYEEAVEVLLSRWDEAKQMETEVTLAGKQLDAGDRRSLLEPVALWLHEKNRREIEADDLRGVLRPLFLPIVNNDRAQAAKVVDQFLDVIHERSGLLIDRGAGMYGFAHLTFQEYLAARAVASKDDFIEYTLKHLGKTWWREVVLLEAGYLSAQGRQRVSKFITAIINADAKTEPEPYHHLILAAECLSDVGVARVEGNLLAEVKSRLKTEVDKPFKKGDKESVIRKVAASNALSLVESGQFGVTSQFWKAPYGEPDWVTIPAGEFWMGSEKGSSDEKPLHRITLPEYQIARVPVTNAQYALYVADANMKSPSDWKNNQPPKGKENHPVVNVTWHEAIAYCNWLSQKINREVRLPSEAEWEKAARGDKDQREYPWGDKWEDFKCNSDELGLGDTSPVGLFRTGASPYGVLEMSGNVWEWTRSLWGNKYPYDPNDKARENLEASDNVARVLRGGAFINGVAGARCAYRNWCNPNYRLGGIGFRVVASPVF